MAVWKRKEEDKVLEKGGSREIGRRASEQSGRRSRRRELQSADEQMCG
jgi:hypothetical protein